MIYSPRTKLSIAVTIILFSLSLSACNQSANGTDQGSQSAAPQSSAVPAATVNAVSSVAVKPAPKEVASTVGGAANNKTTQNQVIMENFAFKPATVTVKAGEKVTWINRDDVPHTVNDKDNRFKSGTMDTDGEFTYSFASPGTYNYFCALHPKMIGQIIVK